MDEVSGDTQGAGIDRRKALQRIGIGAVVAWNAPTIVTSLGGAAYAASAPGCDFDAGQGSCAGQTQCQASGCYCNQNVTNGVPNGQTFCTVPTNCTNQVCQNNADCPPGFVCQATCCDQPRCFEVCGPQTAGAAAPAGGWRSAGGTGI